MRIHSSLNRWSQTFWISVVLIFGGLNKVSALPICQHTHSSGAVLATKNPWPQLRHERLLVNQRSIQVDQGLCGAASSIHALQGVLAKLGFEPLTNPQAAFQEFVNRHIRRGGSGMSPSQILMGLQHLFDVHLRGRSVKLSAQALKGLPGISAEVIPVPSIEISDIRPADNQVKILITAIYRNREEFWGMHAQIVEDVVGDTVHIVDSHVPYDMLIARRNGFIVQNGIQIPKFDYVGPRYQGIEWFVATGVITIDL